MYTGVTNETFNFHYHLYVFVSYVKSMPCRISKGMKRPPNQQNMPDIVYRNGWALVIGVDKDIISDRHARF